MADSSHAAQVIADRYLTSPSRLAARPFGPIDALDTHAGRAAQVRIVFTSGEWQEPELADAVARWCAIGTSGVCGVLDFGRHGDRWFLVLPPSLGTPVERWRSMRRPSAVDAAALTLAFGRLLEAVQTAGFDAGSARLADFAVGPGPTPFLEQPLLTSPAAAVSIARRAGGQQVLAELFTAAVAEPELPPDVEAWRAAAQAASHPSLGVCLDALERAAAAGRAAGADAPPIGLEGIFDGPYAPRLGRSWSGMVRRSAGPLAVALALVGAIGLFVAGGPPQHTVAAPTPRHTTPSAHPSGPTIPAHKAATSSKPHHPASRDVAGHPKPKPHHRRVRTTSAAHRSAPAAPAPGPPSQPTARSTTPAPSPTIILPVPGGTVLPAP